MLKTFVMFCPATDIKNADNSQIVYNVLTCFHKLAICKVHFLSLLWQNKKHIVQLMSFIVLVVLKDFLRANIVLLNALTFLKLIGLCHSSETMTNHDQIIREVER